jgi:hypothetical protein
MFDVSQLDRPQILSLFPIDNMITTGTALELLSAISSAVFLLVLPLRQWQLRRAEIKLSPSWFVPAKVVSAKNRPARHKYHD